jgi:hypothetical protein
VEAVAFLVYTECSGQDRTLCRIVRMRGALKNELGVFDDAFPPVEGISKELVLDLTSTFGFTTDQQA